MTNKEKTMAAALTAVSAYMQMEQEACQEQMAVAAAPSKLSLEGVNVWGQSGRQAMAQMRNLMQLKAFHRFR